MKKVAIAMFVTLVAALYVTYLQDYNPHPMIVPFECQGLQPYSVEEMKAQGWQKALVAVAISNPVPQIVTDREVRYEGNATGYPAVP